MGRRSETPDPHLFNGGVILGFPNARYIDHQLVRGPGKELYRPNSVLEGGIGV